MYLLSPNTRTNYFDQLLTSIEAREQAANDKFMVPVSHYCGGLGCTSLPKTEFNEIISDHHFKTPIDCCDKLAQVTISIGVLCSIILSVSWCASDLIMALLSLVLQLVFNPTWATAPSSLEEHKLNQIPTTITSMLSRFNLHNSTTVYTACPTCSCLSTSWSSSPVYLLLSILPIAPISPSHDSLSVVNLYSDLHWTDGHPRSDHLSTIIFMILWLASFPGRRSMPLLTTLAINLWNLTITHHPWMPRIFGTVNSSGHSMALCPVLCLLTGWGRDTWPFHWMSISSMLRVFRWEGKPLPAAL